MLYQYIAGQTPIDEEEKRGLIPSLMTRDELDIWEEANIIEATEWIMKNAALARHDLLSQEFLQILHKRMFGNVWRWAGSYRLTDKNIGVRYFEIEPELRALLGDARYWQEHESFPVSELAIRLHHRLVKIHLFPNGNGRHSRLVADAFIMKHGGQALTWGGHDLSRPDELRDRYIAGLKIADRGDYAPLIAFATA